VRLETLGRKCLRRTGSDGQQLADPFRALRLAQSIFLPLDYL
jgi:hypothetical protein